MNFIAAYWWLWLLCTVVFGGIVTNNQLKRMRRMMDHKYNPSGISTDSFLSGLGSMVIYAVFAWGSGFMLLLSIIINFIVYFSH